MRLAAGTAFAARSIALICVRVIIDLCPNLVGRDDGGFDLIRR
jgi:hypothetical protein